MRRQIVPALRMLLAMTIVLGLAYPLALTALAQVAFPEQADGSLVEVDGQVVGSRLLGQEVTGPEWFHSRPSAAGAGASGSTDPEGDPSNTASGSSNLGPTNPELLDAVDERAVAYREENGLAPDAEVPVDAVTSSGSGVDPHISVANARLQAPRVAEARDLPLDVVLDLVDDHTVGRSLGFLGEEGVVVLELNLAVAEAAP